MDQDIINISDDEDSCVITDYTPAPQPAPTPQPEPATEPAPRTAPAPKPQSPAALTPRSGAIGRKAGASGKPERVAAAALDRTKPAKASPAAEDKPEAPKVEPPPPPPPPPEPATPASSEDATAAIKKAEAAFGNHHLATARIAATQAMAASKNAPIPVQVRAHIVMGKVQLASEQFSEAERTFKQALALDPGNPLAQRGLERAQEWAAKAKQ